MLLQKSDGEYYLAIWNDELVYSTAASGQPGYDIYQKNVPVTIQFCMPRTFTVYAPNDETGTNPTDAYTLATGSDSIQIDLPAKVLLIKVVGGS
jgi:hypothetical protein